MKGRFVMLLIALTALLAPTVIAGSGADRSSGSTQVSVAPPKTVPEGLVADPFFGASEISTTLSATPFLPAETCICHDDQCCGGTGCPTNKCGSVTQGPNCKCVCQGSMCIVKP